MHTMGIMMTMAMAELGAAKLTSSVNPIQINLHLTHIRHVVIYIGRLWVRRT